MNADLSKLSARPQNNSVRILFLIAILFVVLTGACLIGSIALEYFDSIALNGDDADTESSVYINLSYLADELAWVTIGLGFYAAVLWFLAAIVDRVDQIVWLNASDEDRVWIHDQRMKKKEKNAQNQ